MDGTRTAIACALGGRDGRTLVICAAPLSAHDNRDEREALLLYTRVDTPSAIS
jgi:hypothetical protein